MMCGVSTPMPKESLKFFVIVEGSGATRQQSPYQFNCIILEIRRELIFTFPRFLKQEAVKAIAEDSCNSNNRENATPHIEWMCR